MKSIGEKGGVCVDAQLIHVSCAQPLLPEALLLHLLVSEESSALERKSALSRAHAPA